MRTKLALSILLAGFMLLTDASAHHSPAMLYDLTRQITVRGVVTEFQLGNPHMRLYFDVDNEGTTEKWMAEGGSRTVLLRKGWTGEEVHRGDTVSVRGHPARDGAKIVHMEYLVLPDGREMFAEDFEAGQFEELRRRRRQ